MVLNSKVQGIPCLIRVTFHAKARRATFEHPPEDEEWEFNVLDRRGYAAPWLERKLTQADTLRIEEELSDFHNRFYYEDNT